MTKIKIVGVGGAGNNTVRYMLNNGIESEYVSAYTTFLEKNDLEYPNYKEVAIGAKITKGFGAGGDPQIGELAAEECKEEIAEAIEGADIIFITCGEGGGTGTGAAPVIAKIAKEMGMLTVGVVTKPFSFEGGRRMRYALAGIKKLSANVDSLLVISNNRILELIDEHVSLADALRMSDSILIQALTGLIDIFTNSDLVRLDSADVVSAMREKGQARIGIGSAKGDHKALKAIEAAANNRLLDVDIKKADDIILFLKGDINIGDLETAADYLNDVVGQDVNVLLGMHYDESATDECSIVLIATGIKG